MDTSGLMHELEITRRRIANKQSVGIEIATEIQTLRKQKTSGPKEKYSVWSKIAFKQKQLDEIKRVLEELETKARRIEQTLEP